MTAASTTSASHHPTQTGNGREARPQPADMTAAAERREQFAAGLRELAETTRASACTRSGWWRSTGTSR
jgi:hypothetical protein